MKEDRTIGVIGTLVWDRIVDRDGRSEPVEEWGGIGYALAALRSALPDGWSVMPILKIGKDLAEGGRHFLNEIPGLSDTGLVVVPEPNNRVELRYLDQALRVERLTGGVPSWTWPELAPLVELCDALYVNFISGFEMTLETALALRTGYKRPTYADLHSLFLSMNHYGQRVPRTLEAWSTWLRCFDAVQMNENEFDLLGASGDPWQLAAGALGPELKLITVTLGSRGAAYVVSDDFDPLPTTWQKHLEVTVAERALSGKVDLDSAPRVGDPTGCGDVWGATVFARLLAGDQLPEAMCTANHNAGLNVEHRGARGLYRYLTGQLSHVEEQV
ncbi:MAG: carbohydrate kinase family protein [Gemmatimonadota bacterium]|nr:carbohydrate kinase family protein [Gemmatimonadota bacterium]